MNKLSLFLTHLLVLGTVANTQASIDTIVLSSEGIAEFAGAQVQTIDAAKINAAGHVAFFATLQEGPGGVTAANDKMIGRYEADNIHLIAQEAGNAPGVTGASFSAFAFLMLDDAGTIYARNTLTTGQGGVTSSNHLGIWAFSPDGNRLIARTGSGDVPGLTGSSFAGITVRFDVAGNGRILFEGTLATGGGVTTNNNDGIWSHHQDNGELLLREATTAVPSLPGVAFDNFGTPVQSGNGHITFRAALKTTAGINLTNNVGVWRLEGDGELLARTGTGNVPGMSSVSFSVLEDPLMNSSGQVLMKARLTDGRSGIWRYTGGVGDLIAVTNQSNAPGVPGATYSSFSTPLISNDGQVVAMGTLNPGAVGVNSSNNEGIWSFNDATGDRLLARTNSGGVPDLTDANFAEFNHWTSDSAGNVLLHAFLTHGTGQVDAANDEGIWLLPREGDPQLLVRKGDLLAGRTIAGLGFPTSLPSNNPVLGIKNDAGQFVFRANFTDGVSGFFLYSPETSIDFAAADFNSDGFVNAEDLQVWQAAYGSSAGGDADGDGDTDGRDFLLWQRQYTGITELGALAVPEPGAATLMAIASLVIFWRNKAAVG